MVSSRALQFGPEVATFSVDSDTPP